METIKHINRSTSDSLFETAKTYFPGGVNSPVRAFKSVDGSPIFMKKGDGCHLWDEDGNRFVDFCNGYGALLLGHTRKEIINSVSNQIKKGT